MHTSNMSGAQNWISTFLLNSLKNIDIKTNLGSSDHTEQLLLFHFR
jgi:hypothetical protein